MFTPNFAAMSLLAFLTPPQKKITPAWPTILGGCSHFRKISVSFQRFCVWVWVMVSINLSFKLSFKNSVFWAFWFFFWKIMNILINIWVTDRKYLYIYQIKPKNVKKLSHSPLKNVLPANLQKFTNWQLRRFLAVFASCFRFFGLIW